MIQVGSAEEIYERPASEFVANFIGRTNLLHGVLKSTVAADSTAIVASSIGAVRCAFRGKASEGANVKFVTRPENIEFPDDEGALKENTFLGRVVSRVYLGEVAEYTIRVGDDFSLLARTHPSRNMAPGESVRVRLPSERTIAIFE